MPGVRYNRRFRPANLTMRLSILDQSPIISGFYSRTSDRGNHQLAQAAERLGYSATGSPSIIRLPRSPIPAPKYS